MTDSIVDFLGSVLGSTVAAAIVSAAVSFFVAERKLKREHRLESMAEAAAASLLRQKPFRMRSFDVIKYHLAGFEDDELRKVLVRCGAIRWRTDSGTEYWGGRNCNRPWLGQVPLPEGRKLLEYPEDNRPGLAGSVYHRLRMLYYVNVLGRP